LAVYALDDAIPDIHPEAYIHPVARYVANGKRYSAELRRVH
jgi:hypothetical protein